MQGSGVAAGGALGAAAAVIVLAIALALAAPQAAPDPAPAPAAVPAPAAPAAVPAPAPAAAVPAPDPAPAPAAAVPAPDPAPAPAAVPAPAAAPAQLLAAAGGPLPLVEIFEATEVGTVRVEVRRGVALPGASGVGSGVVFDTRGHIITNSHVVSGADRIIVTFVDGRAQEASLVGRDHYTDIAVVRVDSPGEARLAPLRLGDSSNLRVGEPIAAIGNPFGLSGSMTSGIVSQLGRLLPSRDSAFQIPDVIQTDAAINPGNSGGPLLNMRGEVVGINTAIRSGTGEFAGVGFAIPSQTVAKIVPSLIREGSYDHPWMGISGRDLDPALAGALGLDDTRGFLVVDVVDGGPAQAAGMRGSPGTVTAGNATYPAGGDIIVAVDGNEVRKIDDILVHLQRQKSVGDAMQVEVVRDGRTTVMELELGERPDPPPPRGSQR